MPEYSYFSFVIKNEKYTVHRKIAAFIFFLNSLAFFYAGVQASSLFQHFLLIVVASILLVYSLFSFFAKKKYPKRLHLNLHPASLRYLVRMSDINRSYIVIYLLSALIWFTEIGTVLPSIILLGLMILQNLAQTVTTVNISREGVAIKSYTDVFYTWTELNNLVLKDGLLTIDLVSNKMLQLEPDLSSPVIIRKGGSLHDVDWVINENYPELEAAVNSFGSIYLRKNEVQ